MAVGGARGIAVGAAAAAVVAGCGGSNPGTSQDQRPRMSAIGAAAAGNPRSRGGFGEGREGRTEEEAVVVDGGGRRPPLFYLSLRMGERAEDRGQKFFRSRISFCSFALFCSGDPASADGRGGSFPASVSGRVRCFAKKNYNEILRI